ncbi:MAG: hypothetical protein LBN32_01045, partial [Helicobacteraceae bacterium]|jgi:hypothetical protein|nr:hypothetical protein [Helicobacteraceae bacterium]
MEKTQQSFADLQKRLVGYMLDETLKNAVSEAHSRAALSIDILTRNLYERSADVAFLASDETLIDFMSSSDRSVQTRDAIERRLNDYKSLYTVYSDVVLLAANGMVVARANSAKGYERVQDELISKALSSQEYVQAYAFNEITRDRSMLFLCKIVLGERELGVLALVFDLRDEMKRIFATLGSVTAFADQALRVIGSSDQRVIAEASLMSSAQSYTTKRLGSSIYIGVKAATKGYEGYKGLDWFGIAYMPINSGSGNVSDLRFPSLLSADLHGIINQSDEIGEDLGDVVINGELIASKTRAYALNPILENIRTIGEQTRAIFVRTESDLNGIASASLFNDVALFAKIALDFLDRNLYERSNDCRWWALTKLFRQGRFDETSKALERLNRLYSVYSLLFIYDRQGIIRAVSKHEAAKYIGQQCADETALAALGNVDPQRYFVSRFAPSVYYDGKPTYIYHASITALTPQQEAIGGIGVVFDAQPQMEAILRAVIRRDTNGNPIEGAMNFFVDDRLTVIASTNPQIEPATTLAIEIEYEPSKAKPIEYNGKSYIAAMNQSAGYREYNTNVGSIRSLIMLPIENPVR